MANLPLPAPKSGCKVPLPTPHYMIFALVVVNFWTSACFMHINTGLSSVYLEYIWTADPFL